MQGSAGGVLCEDEAEGQELLCFDSVGDEASVSQGGVELCVARLGVAAVGVDELVGAGEFRDLLKVLSAVEAAFLVAFTGWPFAFAACRAEADSVFVDAMTARDGQHVVPAEHLDPTSLQSFDRHRDRLCSVGVVDFLRDTSVGGPQFVGAATAVQGFLELRFVSFVLFIDDEAAVAGDGVPVHTPDGSVVKDSLAPGGRGYDVDDALDGHGCFSAGVEVGCIS
ncbi:hypothetical protein ABZW18_05195 [Streptomyces sp. NPDC004647]|uniref:hypothetical protein n=1 Tax=Streptomyces sp. NPDC004647 TaxID=3154671 RepID=UPI0033A3EECF